MIPLEQARANIDRADAIGLAQKSADETAESGQPAFSKGPVSRPSGADPQSVRTKKVGRNEPCPCGAVNPNTGKPYKYKKCGLINAPHHRG